MLSQLNENHQLFGVGDLPQDHVSSLVNELEAKALSTDLANGLATKEPTITEGGLAQSKVANLVTDLAGKASSTDLANGLATKEPLSLLSALVDLSVSLQSVIPSKVYRYPLV